MSRIPNTANRTQEVVFLVVVVNIGTWKWDTFRSELNYWALPNMATWWWRGLAEQEELDHCAPLSTA
jgi:hypothetical protein